MTAPKVTHTPSEQPEQDPPQDEDRTSQPVETPELPKTELSAFDALEQPKPTVSPLMGLKEKLQGVRDTMYVDLEVPRWLDTPPEGRGMGVRVFVRFRPIDPGATAVTTERFAKTQHRDWRTMANARILVDCCIGIYAMLPDAADETDTGDRHPGDGACWSFNEADPSGDWTKFDSRLAGMIGMTEVDLLPLANEQKILATVRGIREDGTGRMLKEGLYRTDGDVDMAAVDLINWSARTPGEAAEGFRRP